MDLDDLYRVEDEVSFEDHISGARRIGKSCKACWMTCRHAAEKYSCLEKCTAIHNGKPRLSLYKRSDR